MFFLSVVCMKSGEFTQSNTVQREVKTLLTLCYPHTWPISGEECLGDGFGKLLKLSESMVLGDGVSKAI